MDPITSLLQSATPQIFLQKLEIADVTLRHIKREYYLPLKFVIWSLTEGDIEASFAVTESRQIPSNGWRCVHTSKYSIDFCESFLLIVRTNGLSPFGTVGYSEFPAF